MSKEMGLSSLQEKILVELSQVEPRWTLTGGGALVGFHLGHRQTRDLDLFWRGLRRLDDLEDSVVLMLEECGLKVERIRRATSYVQLRVSDSSETTIVDLVADPTPVIEQPEPRSVGVATIFVDTPYEIFVNKLTTLLSRAELRDLIDVRALLDNGADLRKALIDASQKDGGFSTATLAWVLQTQDPMVLAQSLSQSGKESINLDGLLKFHEEFIERLVALSSPE